jgi:hypothetical protein
MAGDWLPNGQEELAAMAKTWDMMLDGAKTAWGIPDAKAAELKSRQNTVNGMLTTPKAHRTQSFTASLNNEVEALKVIMRDIKKRYFYVPPLADGDLVTLGLKIPDTEPTDIKPPTATPILSLGYDYSGNTVADIKMHQTPNHDPRSIHGVMIYYGIYGQGDKLPETAGDLPKNEFVTGKTGNYQRTFNFGPENHLKTAYFCARYENGKAQQGDWGNMESQTIIAKGIRH